MARQKKKQRAFPGFSLRNADQYDDAAQKLSYDKQRLVNEAAAKESARLESLEGWDDAEAPAAFQDRAFDPNIGGRDPGTGSGVGIGARLGRSGSAPAAFNKLFQDYGISASGTRKIEKAGFIIIRPAELSTNPRAQLGNSRTSLRSSERPTMNCCEISICSAARTRSFSKRTNWCSSMKPKKPA